MSDGPEARVWVHTPGELLEEDVRRLLWVVGCLSVLSMFACGEVVEDDTSHLVLVSRRLDFEQVPVGDISERWLFFENTGASGIDVWVEALPEGFEVLATRDAPAMVPPRGVFELKVAFSPGQVGTFDGSLVLGTSENAGTIVVTLLAEGVSRELMIHEDPEFGIVPIGESRTVSVGLPLKAGTGATRLFLSISGGDAAAFSLSPDEIDLVPGEVVSVDVTFEPIRPGVHGATLMIGVGSGSREYIVRLRGEGGERRLMAAPSALEFGPILPGTSQTLELLLKSSGNLPVEGLRAAFAEGSHAWFHAELPSVPKDFGPGQSFALAVHFSPAEDAEQGAEAVEGALVFYGSDDVPLFDIPLRGVVMEAGL